MKKLSTSEIEVLDALKNGTRLPESTARKGGNLIRHDKAIAKLKHKGLIYKDSDNVLRIRKPKEESAQVEIPTVTFSAVELKMIQSLVWKHIVNDANDSATWNVGSEIVRKIKVLEA